MNSAASPDVEPVPAPTLDRDALDALAWIESGMADSDVGYAPDAPRLTVEQLGEFKPASRRRVVM